MSDTIHLLKISHIFSTTVYTESQINKDYYELFS